MNHIEGFCRSNNGGVRINSQEVGNICRMNIENGAWLNDEPYGAIHRIGSDGEAKGIFAAAINYCKGQIKNLRIDTHEKNQTMRYLLAKHGFKEVGTIYIEDGSPRIAFHLVQE